MKLVVFDTLSGTSGYSRNLNGFTTALHDLGCDVTVYEPVNDLETPERDKAFICNDWNKAVKMIDKDTIVMGRTFNRIEQYRQFNPKMICSILVLEGDKFPEQWIASANLVDMIWASSEYNKAMLKKNNCAARIEVIHHGFDHTIFYPKEKPNTETFKFLFVGGCAIEGDRKGADILARAFNEFNATDSVALTFKINTCYNPDFPVEKYLRSLIKPELQHKLTFITVNMSEEELANLYRSADVCVSPNLGEAFNQSLAESLACGTICIATNYSGHLDFCKPANCYLIDIEKRIVSLYGGFDVGCGSAWVLPSETHLRRLMRHCYENQEEVKQRGVHAAKYMLEHYTWKSVAIMTKNLLGL